MGQRITTPVRCSSLEAAVLEWSMEEEAGNDAEEESEQG
jgi:hypothetical protein